MIEIIIIFLFISIGYMLYKMNNTEKNKLYYLEENINTLYENFNSESPQKCFIVSKEGFSYEPSNTKLGLETAISMLKSNPSYKVILV